MPVQAAVLAASDETVDQLASLLAQAGHTVVSRAVVADKEAALATKLEAWIAESVELVIGVASDEMRGALVPLITKRLLGFSDLSDVDGGRCQSTIVVLLPKARITQELVDKVSSRVANEVARKANASGPAKIAIPAIPGPPARGMAPIPRTPVSPAKAAETKAKVVVPPAPAAKAADKAKVVVPPAAKAADDKAKVVVPAATNADDDKAKLVIPAVTKADDDKAKVAVPPTPAKPSAPKPPPVPPKNAEASKPVVATAPSKPVAAKPSNDPHTEAEDSATESLDDLELQPETEAPKPPAPIIPKRVHTPPAFPRELRPPASPGAAPPKPTPVAPKPTPVAPRPAEPKSPAIEAKPAEPAKQPTPSVIVEETLTPSVIVDEQLESELVAKRTTDAVADKPKSDGLDKPSAEPLVATKYKPAPPPRIEQETVLGDAEPVVATKSTAAPPAAPVLPMAPARSRLWIPLVGVAILGAAAAAGLMITRDKPSPTTVTAQNDPPAAKPATDPTHVAEQPPAEPPPTEPPPAETPRAETPPAETPPAETPPAETPSDAVTPPTKPTTKPKPAIATKPAAQATATETPKPATTETPKPVTTKPKPTKTEPAATATGDGCDQATCVLDNFAKPCCARYEPRPAGAPPYELDGGMVRGGMSKVKAAVIQCGEQHPAKGIVKVAMEVGSDGRVKSASVSQAPDAALGECVAAAVKRATFVQTEIGGSFTYPFNF